VPIGYWVAALDYNKQLEAITVVKPDTLMAIAEVDPAGGDIPGAFEAYPGAAGHLNTRLFTLAYNKPFAVTSVANAPEGGVYILERRFSFLGGFGAEIRYVSAAELHPGARITGTVIANLGGDSNIDNMEGIAARRGPDGKTLLYVMSDDNYNALESTVLMMFEVAG
jgi:hypothetical protein